MKQLKILLIVLAILLFAIALKSRREYFITEAASSTGATIQNTSGSAIPNTMPFSAPPSAGTLPSTIAGLKEAAGVSDLQFNNVIAEFAKGPSANSTPYPPNSPESRLGELIFGLMLAETGYKNAGIKVPILEELRGMMMGMGASPSASEEISSQLIIDPPNPPNDRNGIFNYGKKFRQEPQYLTLYNESASMPDSSIYGAINNALYKNY